MCHCVWLCMLCVLRRQLCHAKAWQSKTPHSRGHTEVWEPNQKWHKSGQIGNTTPPFSGSPHKGTNIISGYLGKVFALRAPCALLLL